MFKLLRGSNRSVLLALLVSNGTCLLLLLMRIIAARNGRFDYLAWNLFLGWLPLLFAWLFVQRLRAHDKRQWLKILLIVLWIGFLPNSFYIASDLIHLYSTGEVSLLFDATMYVSFILNGFIAGYLSLFIMHQELLKRLRQRAHYVIAAVILACSFAIYLGRNLRWNTWDILVHPAGVLFDVTDRIIYPASHPQVAVTTLTFFLLISSTYFVIWQFAAALTKE